MKTKIIAVAIAIVLLVLITVFIVKPFNKEDNTNSNSSSNKQYVELEIKVVEKPDVIHYDCENVQLKFELKNVGKVPFTYDSLENDEYKFSFVTNGTEWPIDPSSEKEHPDLLPYTEIENFGTIQTGETKTITIHTGGGHRVEESDGWTIVPNIFSSSMQELGDNGEVTYILSLYVRYDNRYARVSTSDEFTIKSEIYEAPHSLKECPAE